LEVSVGGREWEWWRGRCGRRVREGERWDRDRDRGGREREETGRCWYGNETRRCGRETQ
jgi:hypothetical protein